jgi:hypothetical protein
VGTNYLHVCNNASGDNAEEADAIYKGINMVLEGETDYFSMEYPVSLVFNHAMVSPDGVAAHKDRRRCGRLASEHH